MTVFPDSTVGDLASRFPETIRVFQRLRIEFCCDGPRRLGDLCHERHLAFDAVAAALADAVAAPPLSRNDWGARPLSDLTAHIVDAFHAPLRQELPRLYQMAVRVQGHSDAYKRVVAVVRYELARFRAELEPHMAEEEREMFPLIDRIDAGDVREGDRARFSQLRAALESDHAQAGHILQILRRVTDRYGLPAHACATLRGLNRALEELEQLMQLHVHLENNVLFPRAAALLREAGIERS